MDDLLDQIEACADSIGLYYLALAGALIIPDICGALEASDGQANGPRYIKWFDTHVGPLHRMMTGEDCYRFRCSFLHQGRSQHPKGRYSRVLFAEPGGSTSVVHMCVADGALIIDVRLFCLEMVAAAREWLGQVAGTEPYETNLSAFVRRYPQGLRPYLGGVAVIS